MNAPLPPDAVSVARLPIDAISASPSNPRKHFDEAYLADLAATIKVHDVIQPITVRPNPTGRTLYELVVGECRWRAAKLAGLDDIPAFWRELDDKQVIEIQVIENLQRRDVHPLEEAEGYELLIKRHGYTAEQIADKIGKSRSYVYGRLKLTALCELAREAFYAGKLDASTALLVARISGESLQKKALQEITQGYGGEPLSFRAAKSHIHNRFTLSLKQATFPLGDAELLAEAGPCTTCPKRSGNNPDLFGDIKDADVCTDTQCFDNKKTTRHLQLIDQAKARNLTVITGEAVDAVAPSHTTWGIDRSQYVPLDGRPTSDPHGPTYREILGDQAPVSAVIELGRTTDKRLVEVAEPKALERALKKAGYAPKEPEVSIAERDRNDMNEDREQELAWRGFLREKVLDALKAADIQGEAQWRQITTLMTVATLRMDADINGLEEDMLAWHDITLPAEYDDDVELERIAGLMAEWTPGQALALLFDHLTFEESRVPYGYRETLYNSPHTLLALGKFVGLPEADLCRPGSEPEQEVQPETAVSDAGEPKIGDRVRIKNDVRGAAGNRRKCCGREGTIEDQDGAYYTVRFSEKSHDKVSNLVWNEFDVIPPQPSAADEEASPPSQAAQAQEQGTSGPETPAKPRPNARYALETRDGDWMTWDGKGKRPAWVTETLAKGQTLKDLEAKADPAPALPANEPAAPVETRTRLADRPAWPFPEKGAA